MNKPAAKIALRACAVVVALGVAVGLSGCLQAATPTSTPTTSHSAAHSHSATPSPSPTPTPTSTPTRFVENCTTLLTPAQVYAYNPNFVADTGYAPKSGTVAAAIRAALGQTCGWVDETSGVELEVAVATPGATGFAAAKAAAAAGTPITANGQQGYFGVQGGVGSAQFFIGTLWLDVSSRDFTVPGDAEPVYSVVVPNQMTAGG
jgi:hypothetical protein